MQTGAPSPPRSREPLTEEHDIGEGKGKSMESGMNTDTQTLHMIGNAHLDPVWLWRWQEGFQEAKSTFRIGAQSHERLRRFLLHLLFGSPL